MVTQAQGKQGNTSRTKRTRQGAHAAANIAAMPCAKKKRRFCNRRFDDSLETMIS